MRHQAGFTLVEVMMAVAVLLIGVLGTVALVDNANRTTSSTRAREGGTNLARDVIEAVRAVPFTGLEPATIAAQTQGQAGLEDDDPAAAGWQLKLRGITYTADLSVCNVDDPRDGVGTHAGGYCTDPAPTAPPDNTPLDYKRVVTTLSWNDGGQTRQVKQATLMNSNYRGPAVTTVAKEGTGTVIESGSTASFTVETGTPATKVEWFQSGRFQSEAAGSGTTWNFTWQLGPACASGSVVDGTYFVAARAYDASGVSAGPRSRTITLNRCPPFAPTGLTGGRNWNSVELLWSTNPEQDIVGYRVYEGSSSTPADCQGASGGVVKKPECRLPDSSPTSARDFTIVALDRDRFNVIREGDRSASYTVMATCGSSPCNRAPTSPTIVSNGTTSTLRWSPTTDPDTGDSVDFYRVYRGGNDGPEDRYDVVDNSGDPIVWTDPKPGSGNHTYWVVAVDSRYSESSFSNSVTR